jgi:hypothetical protein
MTAEEYMAQIQEPKVTRTQHLYIPKPQFPTETAGGIMAAVRIFPGVSWHIAFSDSIHWICIVHAFFFFLFLSGVSGISGPKFPLDSAQSWNQTIVMGI